MEQMTGFSFSLQKLLIVFAMIFSITYINNRKNLPLVAEIIFDLAVDTADIADTVDLAVETADMPDNR